MFKKKNDLITNSNLLIERIEEIVSTEIKNQTLRPKIVEELILLKIEIENFWTWAWKNAS